MGNYRRPAPRGDLTSIVVGTRQLERCGSKARERVGALLFKGLALAPRRPLTEYEHEYEYEYDRSPELLVRIDEGIVAVRRGYDEDCIGLHSRRHPKPGLLDG